MIYMIFQYDQEPVNTVDINQYESHTGKTVPI